MIKSSLSVAVLMILALTSGNQLRANQRPILPSLDVFLQTSQDDQQVAKVTLNDTLYAPLDEDEEYAHDYNDRDENISQSSQRFIYQIQNTIANSANVGEKLDGQQENLFKNILQSFESTVGDDLSLQKYAEGDISSVDVQSLQFEKGNIQVDPSQDTATFGESLKKQLTQPLTQAVEYHPSSQGLFGLNDKDDDEFIRTQNGIYKVVYLKDRQGAAQVDFDDEYDEFEKEVDEIQEDLDDAAEDLDEDLNDDKDDSDDLKKIQNQPGFMMSDDDRNDIDDITDRLYDAIQRYNEEVEDYKEKELRMLRDDDKDDINQATDIVDHLGLRSKLDQDEEEEEEECCGETVVVIEANECCGEEEVVLVEEDCDEEEEEEEEEEHPDLTDDMDDQDEFPYDDRLQAGDEVKLIVSQE